MYIYVCITFFALTLCYILLSTLHGVYTRDCSCTVIKFQGEGGNISGGDIYPGVPSSV